MKVRDFSSPLVGPVGRSFNFSPSSSHHTSRVLSGASRPALPKGETFHFRNPTQMPCNCQTTSAPFYFCVHSHGLIVARNKGKRAIDNREQPL